MDETSHRDVIPLSEKYKAALSEHKHYDNISLVLTPGIVLIPVGSFHLAQQHEFAKIVVLTAGAFVTVSVFFIYRQLSSFASIARQISADIELGKFEGCGPSHEFFDTKSKYVPRRGFTYKMVCAITIASVSPMIIYAIKSLCPA